jgi:hypothetical protein
MSSVDIAACAGLDPAAVRSGHVANKNPDRPRISMGIANAEQPGL